MVTACAKLFYLNMDQDNLQLMFWEVETFREIIVLFSRKPI